MNDPDRLVDSLTDKDREVLRLFLRTSDPKAIARTLGLSSHTIDKRLATVRRKLGVSRSLDAALILARAEGDGGYQRAVYHPSAVEEPSPDALNDVSPKGGRWPFPSEGRPWNTLPIAARIRWMAVAMICFIVAALLVADIAEVLTRILRRH